MLKFLLAAACAISAASGFGAPGIVPPESFVAERWYPSNLPTVMPPWKMPGVDISHFQTARPHQSPGTRPITTTPVTPLNALPMPPGTSTSVRSSSDTPSTTPHPPGTSGSPVEASGVPSSAETSEEGSSEPLSSTISSVSDDLMTIAVTATNLEKIDTGAIKILSPVFEDITRMDNSSNSDEILGVIMRSDGNETEGSGVELMTTLETTTFSLSNTAENKTTTTAIPLTKSSTMATESSSVSTNESTTKSVIELLNVTSSSTTTTPVISSTTASHKNANEKDDKKISSNQSSKKKCKDILFLLDSSGNVLQQYEKQKKYIEEIVNQLEAKVPRRMSLITFAGRTRQKIVVPLPDVPNGQKFIEKLKKARFLRGVTAAGAAISATTQYVLQKSTNVQVVVVTDGFSFDDVDSQSEALRTVVGKETYVTGRYFPIVRSALLSIGGVEDHVYFEKREHRLIDALQC